MYIEKSYIMYYCYSYFNVAILVLNGNANKDCCCCVVHIAKTCRSECVSIILTSTHMAGV